MSQKVFLALIYLDTNVNCHFLFPFEVSRPERLVRNTPYLFTVAKKIILNDSLFFKLFVFFLDI